jgi:hypothetical protein
MKDPKVESIEAVRKAVHEQLMSLTPEEAKALRARFRIDNGTDAVDGDLKTLLRILSPLPTPATISHRLGSAVNARSTRS